jgi:Ig-like domain from next to BRCA1 gene
MFKTFRIISLVSIFILILSACNLPSGTPTEEANVIFTAAALTVQAQSTQLAPFNTPTLPPVPPTNTAVTIPTATVFIPTTAPVFSPTPACDQALFVKDVTIPDGTVIAPGTTFKKTWRLRNIGTCTWSGYSLVFDSGEAMSPVPDPIGTVASGQEVDVSVTFIAPTTNNTYRSYWRVRNASGVLLPVSFGNEGKSFYVEIKVAAVSSGFDFHTQASSAIWISGAGNLTFGGPDTDTNGFAMFKNGQKLEDGTTHTKILETHPQWVNDGVITGRFPAYTVVSGEHFTAKIGFLALSDGTCGTGNAKFQLNYREAGVLKSLNEWTESCDGTMKAVDVNLTSLAGKSVEFVLAVLANGSAGQDWAVWVAPQIAIP